MTQNHSQLKRTSFAISDLEIRSKGDGRTVVGIAVPFDVETDVGRYREVFRRGAFARTVNAGKPERVKFYGFHPKPGEAKQPIGAAKVLREEATGLYGEFRVSRTQQGDEVLALIEDGALDGLSIGFVPEPGKSRTIGDLVERQAVRLEEVSVVAHPAYMDAQILAVREEDANTRNTMTLVEASRIASLL